MGESLLFPNFSPWWGSSSPGHLNWPGSLVSFPSQRTQAECSTYMWPSLSNRCQVEGEKVCSLNLRAVFLPIRAQCCSASLPGHARVSCSATCPTSAAPPEYHCEGLILPAAALHSILAEFTKVNGPFPPACHGCPKWQPWLWGSQLLTPTSRSAYMMRVHSYPPPDGNVL